MSDNKCLSCLKNGKHKDIFSVKYKGQSMDSIFQLLTSIQINKDVIELNINQICSGCTAQLKSFFEFRKKAITSYDKLFALKFIPDGNVDDEFLGSENDIEVIKDEGLLSFTFKEDLDDNKCTLQEEDNNDFEESESWVPKGSQSLGLLDINNLFKDESKKWHCLHCNLIFPVEEQEEIQKHMNLEQKKLKSSKVKKITVKKITNKTAKDFPKTQVKVETPQKRKVKVVKVNKEELLEEKLPTITPVKMFRPNATEQIRTSTIIKKLPGNIPNLISDINDILKSEQVDDDENEDDENDIYDDENYSEDAENNRKGKKKYNFLNTDQTKIVRRIKRAEPRKYICDVCGKEMGYASTLRVHMTMHTGKKFVCKLCGSGYVTRAGLTQHMNKHEQRKDFTCTFCGKSFYSNTDLLGHIYDKRQAGSHLDETCAPFTRPICEICGKTFYNMKTLKLHVSTHKQTKDYPCPQCDRKFFHEHKLNMHLWTHEVQFRCMKCYNIYKQIEFKKHECRPDPEKQSYEPLDFECRICGQIFKGPGRYEQHQKTHNLKECKICKKKFNCSAKLFRCHLNTHSFKCTLCDKGFAKKTSWKYHVENQTCLKGKKAMMMTPY